MDCTDGSSFNNNFRYVNVHRGWCSETLNCWKKEQKEKKKKFCGQLWDRKFLLFLLLSKYFFVQDLFHSSYIPFFVRTILKSIPVRNSLGNHSLSYGKCWWFVPEIFLIWSFWSSIFIIFLQHYVNSIFSLERSSKISFSFLLRALKCTSCVIKSLLNKNNNRENLCSCGCF